MWRCVAHQFSRSETTLPLAINTIYYRCSSVVAIAVPFNQDYSVGPVCRAQLQGAEPATAALAATQAVTPAIPTAQGETVWNVAVVVAKQLNLEPGSSVETINVEGARRLGIPPFDEGGNRKWKLSILADELGIAHGWTFVPPT